MSEITTYSHDGDVKLTANPETLRSRYKPELLDDGMYDSDDSALIQWCYEQNCDLPEIVVEETL